MLVNTAGSEDYVPEMAPDGMDLPVLQDTTTDKVFVDYGASKWYIYVLDAEGNPRYVHYQVDLNGERDRLLSEIDDARGAR